MHIDMKKYFVIIPLLAVLSCTKQEERVPLYEIGALTSEYNLGYEASEVTVEILSNGDFTAVLPEDTPWIRFPDGLSAKGSGDCSLMLSYDTNRSIPRSVVMTLTSGTNTSEVIFHQDGLLSAGISISEKCITVPAEGGPARVRVNTALSKESLSFSVDYVQSEDEEWIHDVRMEGNYICFDVAPILNAENFRHARISVTSGSATAVLLVGQTPSGVTLRDIGLATLKATLTKAGSTTIPEHIVLQGQVLNDSSFGNGAENRNVSVDIPDREWKYGVLYLQDVDGGGIKVNFDSRCDDLVDQFGMVGIDLFGATLTREDAPLRYTLSGLQPTSVVSSKGGIRPNPAVRSIGSLGEGDLYTLVTVEGVEIPFRKGPYVPLDIRYISYITAYPVTLRDKSGDTLPMMINADCTFSRDGSGMPQGSGSVTGVLVHETCDHVEWDTEAEKSMTSQGIVGDYVAGIGNIGPWQIRPMRKSDIAISENFEEGFSELLYEWRYCASLSAEDAPSDSYPVRNCDTLSHTVYPTYPAVADPTSLPARFYCENTSGERAEILPCNDFTLLGPYEYGGTIAAPELGNGVTDYYLRSAQWRVVSTSKTAGTVYSSNKWKESNGSAWKADHWSTNRYWCVSFPTDKEGIKSPLSVQVGFNGCALGASSPNKGAPRFWKVECSLNGTVWSKVADYTVPDFPAASSRRVWQLPGTKYITVNLPDNMIGREEVYVRLIPSENKAGNASSYVASGNNIGETSYNAINYFAIRYNK